MLMIEFKEYLVRIGVFLWSSSASSALPDLVCNDLCRTVYFVDMIEITWRSHVTNGRNTFRRGTFWCEEKETSTSDESFRKQREEGKEKKMREMFFFRVVFVMNITISRASHTLVMAVNRREWEYTRHKMKIGCEWRHSHESVFFFASPCRVQKTHHYNELIRFQQKRHASQCPSSLSSPFSH